MFPKYELYSVVASTSKGNTQNYCRSAPVNVVMLCRSAVNWMAEYRQLQPPRYLGCKRYPRLIFLESESIRGFDSVKLLAHYCI